MALFVEHISTLSAELEKYENLQINALGSLFAKVTERLENGCRLKFTAKPPEFDEWKQRFEGKGKETE